MVNEEFRAKVKALPGKQQLAIWVIIDKFHTKKGTMFTVSEFGDAIKKFLIVDDIDDLGRMLGGILSSLVRNGMIEQISGGRKPIWQLVPELHNNAKVYKDGISAVVTYWMSPKDK